MQERGFTNSQLPQKRALPQQSSVAAPEVSKIGGRIDITSDVMCALGRVRKDDDDTRWMLAEYETAKGPVTCTGQGSGDLSELKESLDDAKVMYGLYRVTDTVDDITTVKFVYIQWYGINILKSLFLHYKTIIPLVLLGMCPGSSLHPLFQSFTYITWL